MFQISQSLSDKCRSGVLLTDSGNTEYVDHAYKNDLAIGARLERCASSHALRETIPLSANPSLDGFHGYMNHDGGWVESGRAVSLLTDEIKRQGVRVEAGCKVTSLLRENGKTVGVSCEGGRTFQAGKVILASGAWTASSFADEVNLGLEARCLATGSVITSVIAECPLTFVSGKPWPKSN
jgi:sarcosine oxidase/L-pipecolate oxidase